MMARVARVACARQYDVRVRLYKRIPSEAGLGGGSSDATATLVVLNQLHDSIFTRAELGKIASAVGSDAPLFLEEGASVCTGRGEIVRPIRVPRLDLTLVKPNYGISTALAYERCDATSRAAPRRLDDFCAAVERAERLAATQPVAAASEIGRALWNRLEFCLASVHSGAFRQRRLLDSFQPLGSLMTGSGSCFFAIHSHAQRAFETARRLRRVFEYSNQPEFAGEKVFVAHTIDDRKEFSTSAP